MNQTNRVRFIASKNLLRVYFNGVLATSVHDSHYTEGHVRLAVGPGANSPVDVVFSDLQLREVK